jgi:hypothetical protein
MRVCQACGLGASPIVSNLVWNLGRTRGEFEQLLAGLQVMV